jgi:hypothetical protein
LCHAQGKITPKENLMRAISCAFFVLLTAGAALADQPHVRQLIARYHAIRPDDDQLAMYRLDWETSLTTAQERALLENRPVCLVVIHARYGDITSGHC